MVFQGKRSERIRIPQQVNADPDLALAIRVLAERNMRPIGNEIVSLLTDAILNHPVLGVHAQFLTHAHTHAQRRARCL